MKDKREINNFQFLKCHKYIKRIEFHSVSSQYNLKKKFKKLNDNCFLGKTNEYIYSHKSPANGIIAIANRIAYKQDPFLSDL